VRQSSGNYFDGVIVSKCLHTSRLTYSVAYDEKFVGEAQDLFLRGSLPVDGAFDDSIRIAELIQTRWYY
jgi:hypothetical protein